MEGMALVGCVGGVFQGSVKTLWCSWSDTLRLLWSRNLHELLTPWNGEEQRGCRDGLGSSPHLPDPAKLQVVSGQLSTSANSVRHLIMSPSVFP